VAIYSLPDSLIPLNYKDCIAALIFAVAAFTDYLDGYLARKLKQESSFGAFLDPVADKALVVAALIILTSQNRTFIFATIIIIVREIAVSALREWMAQIGGTKNTAVHYIGKLKTVVQFLAIFTLLFNYNNITNTIGNILMLFAVLLTVISMFYYLEQAKKYIKNNSN
jgi:CDP-diacylglycerol--glycerol-3-phosphate 3-phosphatidyltransferase/cardiolipin synthase